jgi:hypothetical protein
VEANQTTNCARTIAMTIQGEEGNRRVFQSAGGQITVLSVAIVIALALAWIYVF